MPPTVPSLHFTTTEKAEKKVPKKAVKAEDKGSGLGQKDLPAGTKVKCIGGHVKKRLGKQGEVVRTLADDAVVVKWSDGTVGGIRTHNVERVKK